MAPTTPRLKTLAVGGNPVSAFLSWRLQATNACDVTLVWKSAYDHVAQYGISFKSPVFGNERFKPRHVVRTPEDAASNGGTFDYVILCIKALPDVYDLAAVIDSVVRPHHTCIIVNTTHALGVESAIEERFPTNVVLSLVSGAELSQLNQSEFEHRGSTEIWIGPANANKNIPAAIQEDMAQALAMTLSGAQVDCKVSSNIRQQQYERVIGPIAFHPASVIFETPNHAALMEKVGVSQLVADVIDELLALASAQGCQFSEEFKQKTIEEMTQPATHDSIMYQDYVARRPMEVETYLGSPIKLAQTVSVKVPRIETLYAVLFNINLVNRSRPRDAPAPSGSPSAQSPLPPRMSSQPGPRGMPNGMPPNGNGIPRPRPRGPPMGPMPPGGRRPPMMNGGRPSMNGPPNGYHPPSSRAASRRGSMDGNDMEEFSHLVLYDDIPEAAATNFGPQGGPGRQEFALRERELQLKQRELALRERAMSMGRRPGPPGRRGPPRNAPAFDEEDDEDDYFDPNAGPVAPMIDPDNFDMMSVTSRKNRKIPSATQMRNNPEGSYDNMPPSRSGRFRPSFGRNRSSQSSQMNSIPGLHENILDDPLLGYSSNRYGNVDRGAIQAESRANSLTASRLDEMQYGPGGPGGGMNGPFPRRTSQSPGNLYSPSARGGRPSPPNGFGPQMNGRPSPEGMRQPVPRYPPGQANIMAPQQVEQHVGVSLHQPLKTKSTRSLTGSASASAGSGDSARLDSEASAHSSQSSLGPRPPIGVR